MNFLDKRKEKNMFKKNQRIFQGKKNRKKPFQFPGIFSKIYQWRKNAKYRRNLAWKHKKEGN